MEFWKFIWKWKFGKLNLKNRNFEELFENGSFEIIWELKLWKVFENESFEIIWELELWKVFEKLELGKLLKYQEIRNEQVDIGLCAKVMQNGST